MQELASSARTKTVEEADGWIYVEQAALAGIYLDRLTIGTASRNFLGGTADNAEGIVGLGPEGGAELGEDEYKDRNTLLDSLAKSKALATVQVSFVADCQKGQSSLVLGGMPEEAEGTVWADVIETEGWWEGEMELAGNPIKALIDSGTTYIIGPFDEAKALLSSMEGVEVIEASDNVYGVFEGDIPPFPFDFGSETFSLKIDDQRLLDGKIAHPIYGSRKADTWTFGLPVMKQYITTFDFDGRRFL